MDYVTDHQTIGQLVRLNRGALSQEQVVDALRRRHNSTWSQTTLSKVEKGERPLRLQEAHALAQVLGVPIGAFVGEDASGPIHALAELRVVQEFVQRRVERLEGSR